MNTAQENRIPRAPKIQSGNCFMKGFSILSRFGGVCMCVFCFVLFFETDSLYVALAVLVLPM